MKGWLKKYDVNANDSNVTVPEGFVGMGNDISGRKFSPAWGGQFGNGGEIMNVASLDNPIAQNGLIAHPGGNRNIHTNRPVISPREEYEAQQAELRNRSELAEWINKQKQYQQEHSDIIRNDKGEVDKIQSIGIQPTASPIDAAVLGVGALASGGIDLLASMINLANPIPINPRGIVKGAEELVIAPADAARLRATRMLSQVDKFSPENAEAVNLFNTINKRFSEVKANTVGHSPSSLGVRTGDYSFVFKDAPLTPAQRKYIASHETGHLYTNSPNEANEWISNFNINKLSPYLKGKPIYKPLPKVEGMGMDIRKGRQLASNSANEIRERAAQLKDFIAVKKGIPLSQNYNMTEKELNYAIKNFTKETGLDNNMTQLFSALKNKKGFLKQINTQPLTVLPALTGVSQLANESQDNPSYAYGGIIKDNNGYWNPANWGKSVEIDSNDITMRGVNVPLMGISDTGDMKMMYPGQDYHFKGKRVTELPIAQNGTVQKKQEGFNLTDLTFTPSEINYLNTNRDQYCPGGNCLEGTRKAYDNISASISGIPDTNKIWEDDLGIVSVNYPPTEELKKKYPYMIGDTKVGSVDSWDIQGQIIDRGGKNIYSVGKGAFPKNEDIPVGAVIGWGPAGVQYSTHYDRQQGLNYQRGLQPSHHSTMVVGYNENGEPVVYDAYLRKYGTLNSIAGDLQGGMLKYEIENIGVPKSVAENTRANIEKRGVLKTEYAPYKADVNSLIGASRQSWAQIYEEDKPRSPRIDMDAMGTFSRSLEENKGVLMSNLNISNEEYDRLADTALAIAMVESEGGGALNIIDRLGTTQGMTQLDINNILKDDRLKKARSKYYNSNWVKENSDLRDPYRSALATMMYLSVLDKDSRRYFNEGKNPGIRRFYEPSGLKEMVRTSDARINKNGIYIEEINKRIPLEDIDGYSDKDINRITASLKKLTGTSNYKAGRDREGNVFIEMNTKGNIPNMSDAMRLGYAWQSPTSLKTGDAAGNSKYAQRVEKYYQALEAKRKKAMKKENGGVVSQQSDRNAKQLEQLTNFTNQNKPADWLNKYE